jgi:hypothetical protein
MSLLGAIFGTDLAAVLAKRTFFFGLIGIGFSIDMSRFSWGKI